MRETQWLTKKYQRLNKLLLNNKEAFTLFLNHTAIGFVAAVLLIVESAVLVLTVEDILQRDAMQDNPADISAHEHEKLTVLKQIHALVELQHKAETPENYSFNGLALGQPFVIDYKARKHIFIYQNSGASINLVNTEFGTVPLPNVSWTNWPFPQGSKWQLSANALLNIRCTDEAIP